MRVWPHVPGYSWPATLELNHSPVFLPLLLQFFVLCHSLLQLSQLLVSGYMKSSISTIERRYGLNSRKSGLLAAFNEVSLCLDLFGTTAPIIPKQWCCLLLFCVCVCVCDLAMCSASPCLNAMNCVAMAARINSLQSDADFWTFLLVCVCRWATRFSSFLWASLGAGSIGRGSLGAEPCWPAWRRCSWPYHTSSVDRMSTQIALAVRPNTNQESQPQHSHSHRVLASIDWTGLVGYTTTYSVCGQPNFSTRSFYFNQQPPVTTALASAKWTAPSAALPPSRAAPWKRILPSRWSIRCCWWVSCCWELRLSPYSHLASPTSTTTPAKGTHHFTLVNQAPVRRNGIL